MVLLGPKQESWTYKSPLSFSTLKISFCKYVTPYIFTSLYFKFFMT